MTYADDYNLRLASATQEDVADALDGLLVKYGAQEHSTLISTSSLIPVVYTGSSITVAVAANQIVEIDALMTWSNDTISSGCNFTVEQDGVDLTPIGRFFSHRGSGAGTDITTPFKKIVAPSVGSHTYKIKWYVGSNIAWSARAYMSVKVFQNA